MFSIFVVSLITVSLACNYNGKTLKDGEEWTEKNVFIMRCTMMDGGSWKTEVTACVTPSGIRIPINETHKDERSQWTCSITPDGKITMQHGVNPDAKCDGHDVGSKWIEKSFEFECMPGGNPKLLACVGENSQKIPVGTTKEIDGYQMNCQQFDNGTIILHGTRKSFKHEKGNAQTECVDAHGNHHPAGSTWLENERFNKICTESGRIDIESCVTQTGQKVPINGELIEGDTKYVCEKTKEGAVRYSSGPKDE